MRIRLGGRALGLVRLEDRLAPATWDGGGGDILWTTAENWVGDVAPQPGDDLVFPPGASLPTNFNDFPNGTRFNSITVESGGYEIRGKDVVLGAGVTANIGANFSTTMRLNIGGRGGVIKSGSGRLILEGDNSYSGLTDVSAGFLEVRSSTALGALGVGNQTAVADGATLTLAPGNWTIAEPIIFAGTGVPQPLAPAGAIQFTGGNVVLSGLLVLSETALITGQTAGGPDRLTITGGVLEGGGSFGLQLNVTPLIVFAPSSVNSYTGPTEVLGGSAEFDGQNGAGPTMVHGLIAGAGTLGPVLNNGAVSPGTFDSQNHLVPGTLTVGDLDLSGFAPRFLVGASGYSRISARGTVHIGGTNGIDLTTELGLKLHVGDSYVLIDNDGADPISGAFAGIPDGSIIESRGGELRLSYRGGDGNDLVLMVVSRAASAVGMGAGGLPRVNVYDGNGDLLRSFLAYDSSFRGGVRVATADLNGDGAVEIITAPESGGGPVVRIWDGATGALLREFNSYDPNFRGGVFLSAARIDTGDTVPDIITGAGAGGGPHVRVFSGATGQIISEWLAYDPSFSGGVSVAGMDVNAFAPTVPGRVATGTGIGGGPHVRIFNGATGAVVSEFFAYDPAFRGGVNVASGFLNGGMVNSSTIVTAPGPGGGPDVRVYDLQGHLQSAFLAYDPAFRGGVTLAIWKPARYGGTFLPGGPAEILTGAGPGGSPHVEQWEFAGTTPVIHRSFLAFDPTFAGGVLVG
jgi:autotransporter-associated beta strand protein